ncbi:MAG: efflux RND transporter periplasmic adaptor subunit [Phenylobacterium sp.]|uniref:efflux RND transporter periplasmic adaptor subunit n=1 Tax=Phenylobacterium sp. TaxID=1871053 RepID=UPI001A4E5D4D|nr:efflux RND transporter periplasmic adaptor subunit [Phenylobacterium sp.]MBL8771068.1 efflux RND transporter periplasmic adaptor subunit [Phenylobacterium sp.]
MAVLDLQARRQPGGPEPEAPPARRRRNLPWRRGLLALAVAAAAGYGGWRALQPVEVATAAVSVGPAVDAVYASGVVEYVRQARIAPVVTAPIRRVLVEEGQAVRAGQPLAELEDGPQEGSALQLEAQAGLARAVAARQARLQAAGFGARAVYEDAQAQARAADAAARSARARLADYRLTAPFAGHVIRRDAEPGDLASVGRPMFVVADTATLRITADIDERDVGRLAVGQDAVVRSDSFPGRTFAARIAEVTPQGDSAGRTFRARLALPAGSALRPGMTVESNLVTGRRERAVLAPASAVRDGGVWIIEDGRARRRAVQTGAQGPERTEIVSGLKPGDRVIVSPPEGLKDGARVKAGG